MILFDTDVCLMLLKGNKKILQTYCNVSEEICISDITAQELFLLANASAEATVNRITVEKFLLTVRIVYPDLGVLKYAADIQFALQRKGQRVAFQDLIIYCLSKGYGAKLITTSAKRYCFT
jgi:predicted nucleic acid-binding protein